MSTDTESGSSQGMSSNGAGWIAALVGIWVLISPFFWGATSGTGLWGGGGAWLYWSNVISGIVIAILAGYAARSGNTQAGWLAALVGLWVLITPFFWGTTGSAGGWWGGGGAWLYWSNVISGIVVAILAGYTARARGAGSSSSATT